MLSKLFFLSAKELFAGLEVGEGRETRVEGIKAQNCQRLSGKAVPYLGERGTLCRPVVGRAYLARWDYLPCELACRSVRRVGVRIANLRTFSHSSSLFTHPTATFVDKLLSWTSRAIDVIPPFQRRLASAVVCNHYEAMMMMMSIINHHRHHEV